jgi:hypothetical protein
MDARDRRLLRDFAAVGRLTAEPLTPEQRPTARERLERELGPDLARRLTDALRPKPRG